MKSFFDKIKVPSDCHLYICFPTDLDSIDQVEYVLVPKDSQDPKKVVYQQLASKEVLKNYFQEYCMDDGCDSLNDLFYKIDGEYAYNISSWDVEEVLPADHILAKFDGDVQASFKYIDEKWNEKVDKFFVDEPSYGVLFKQHYKNTLCRYFHSPLRNNMGFFQYVAEHLYYLKEWCEFHIVRVEQIESNEE